MDQLSNAQPKMTTSDNSAALLAHVDALQVVAQVDVNIITLDGSHFAFMDGPNGPEIVGFALAEGNSNVRIFSLRASS